ncbi:MAG: Adenylosuccinate lyase @ SAICAR lyase, partial [uncultured Acetobacteraceae bacterium]
GPPLHPPGDGGDLVARRALPDLVRHRGAGRRSHGRGRRDPGRGRARHPRARRPARRRDLAGRRRAHRRDRAHHAPRRHRLPDLDGGGHRGQRALHAPGHDQFGRARHLLVRAVDARRRPAPRRLGRPARGAEEARVGAPAYAHRRPQPRHPRRTHHLRPQTGRPLRRVRPEPRPPARGARRGRHLRHLRPCRHLRRRGPARGSLRRRAPRPGGGAGQHAGDPARPPRRLFRRARRGGLRRGALGDRGAPPPALRGARSGGVLPPGAEGQQRHAPQAQPGAEREPDRPRALGALARRAGAGERRALARARHQPLLRGTGDRPGRHDRARLRPGALDRHGGALGGLPGAHAGEPGRARRRGAQPEGAAGADSSGHEPRGRLRRRPVRRHDDVASAGNPGRSGLPRRVAGGPRRARAPRPGRARSRHGPASRLRPRGRNFRPRFHRSV